MTARLPFLPEAHHFALAAVAARSAQLDHAIEYAIVGLMGSRISAGRYLLRRLRGDHQVGLLDALLRDAFPDAGAKIDALIGQIRTARDRRNEMMHWVWGASDAADTATISDLRPHRDERTRAVTALEMTAVASQMLDAVHALRAWADRYWQQATSPHRP